MVRWIARCALKRAASESTRPTPAGGPGEHAVAGTSEQCFPCSSNYGIVGPSEASSAFVNIHGMFQQLAILRDLS